MFCFRRPPSTRALILQLHRKIENMSTAFERVVAQVAELKSVEEGVVAVVDSLATQVRAFATQAANQGVPVSEQQLNDLADQLEAIRAPLSVAIVTGTAAATVPGDDTVTAPAGDDTLEAGAGNDVIDTSGDETTAAPELNDTIDGGAGNDTIDAGSAPE